MLIARNKLISGEEFEDDEKFKRFVQMANHQINKMNFERKKELISGLRNRRLIRNQTISPSPIEETLSYEDLLAIENHEQTI